MICSCTSCGTKYKMPDSMAGKAVWCKKCHSVIWVPAAKVEKKEVEKKIHFLMTPRMPVMLSKEEEVIIGRDVKCEVHIDDVRISREHARISWNGEYFCIEDLNSTNGVFVNGERIDKLDLQDNAKISIGGSLFTYRTASDVSEMRSSFRKSRRMRKEEQTSEMQNVLQMAQTEDLNGSLRNISCPEICQFVQLGSRTGALCLVTTDNEKAFVFFESGKLVHAQFKKIPADMAMFAILDINDGFFSFRENLLSNKKDITNHLNYYLLEHSRLQDERQNAPASPQQNDLDDDFLVIESDDEIGSGGKTREIVSD